jgi:phosphoribosylamine---glycine ligase
VIGGGGREHALAWKLSQEAEVICAPGNAGIAADVECVEHSPKDSSALISFCKDRAIDLVVVGPEDPLVDGLADQLRAAGILVFGPNQAAAQLEGSKAFSKEMMARAGVPTAAYGSFDDPAKAKQFCEELFANGKQVAVKASGNALGKGVIVCDTLESALSAVETLSALGEAGRILVVEEKLVGREFSLLTLVSDDHILSLPVAQDYKRVYDNNQGPNTGGMGTYSPLPWLPDALVARVEEEIVKPVIQALAADGIDYRGVLFSGIMVTSDGPKCLEYNVRFGDPETQSVMCRLGSGLAKALLACAKGETIPQIEVLSNAVVTVVTASGGYPDAYQKGLPITIADIPDEVKVFHAGTKMEAGQLVTNGGRVLAVTATANDHEAARNLAYKAIQQICFEGMHYRKDIGA